MRGGGAGGFATMIGIPVEMVAIGVVEGGSDFAAFPGAGTHHR